MFSTIDALPTATSLFMQCGHRSKVCTNTRAIKIDGSSLHKLCEFHRRKANANQQRLHQRQRDQRAKRQRIEVNNRSALKEYPSAGYSFTIDSIPYIVAEPEVDVGCIVGESEMSYPRGFFTAELASSRNTSVDMEMMEMMVIDTEPLTPNVQEGNQHNSSFIVDGTNSIIV
ncbi:unnamed protein product [Phytophthora lilii]|uniref:Unnamed protein product n=1 Tax=Phytophthora lilii TaxID=2077276 RepID=A0A9W7D9S6_9STRA|nr:unnamed protein product [Phytophthora lilii]